MENKDVIKQALRELYEEGCIIAHPCPWQGVSDEKVNALKDMEPLPTGAVKMVVMTWGVLSSFGKKAGNAVAMGAFCLLCILIVLGAFGIGRVVQICFQLMSR